MHLPYPYSLKISMALIEHFRFPNAYFFEQRIPSMPKPTYILGQLDAFQKNPCAFGQQSIYFMALVNKILFF